MDVTKIAPEMLSGGGSVGGGSVYPSRAEFIGTSPPIGVNSVVVLGWASPGDGGGGIYKANETPATNAFVVTANGRKFELVTEIANVRQFGALGLEAPAGTYNDGNAFRAAFAYAKSKRCAVYAPAGTYHFPAGETITIDSQFTFYGDGPLTVLRCTDHVGTLFNINLATAPSNTVDKSCFRDFAAQAWFSSGSIAHTGVLISVSGPTNSAFSWSLFKNIVSCGFYSFFVSTAGHHVTVHGNEGPTSWNQFHNITFMPFSRHHKRGFIFNTGSGTGNTFIDCNGGMEESVWLYQGAGGGSYVVGDIVIMGGQFGGGGAPGSRVFVVASGMQYRSRLRIQGMQADAGMEGVLSISGASWSEVLIDVTRGGGTIMGTHPALESSSYGLPRSTIGAT